MTLKAASVKNYLFKSQDKLFLDANIWLYIYAPQNPKSYWVNVYSKTFGRILTAKSCIYIDILVISEFINAYARLKWHTNASHIDSKLFATAQDFKPIAQEIADNTKRVLSHYSRIENDFKIVKIDDLLNDYATGDFDFNDQMITDLCKRKGLKLITNDGDFKGQGIPILTANGKLLR